MTRLAFTKMHGLGNDFMLVDLLTQSFSFTPQLIRLLSDRHTGIGFDQLLTAEAPRDSQADFRYRIYNADGSEAEQCGNGARCFARFVIDRRLSKKRRLRLEMNQGCITTAVLDDGQVEVDMGMPAFEHENIPLLASAADDAGQDGSIQIVLDEQTCKVHPVSMGNPHGVIFVDTVASAPVQTVGSALSRHPAFPQGANIGFCQIVDSGFVRLRVFERGSGETRACGSGACAATVAGQRAGLLGEKVKVSLPGGKVRISWLGNKTSVRMVGSVCFVFEGNVNI